MITVQTTFDTPEKFGKPLTYPDFDGEICLTFIDLQYYHPPNMLIKPVLIVRKWFWIMILFQVACQQNPADTSKQAQMMDKMFITPPVCPQRPYVITTHGHERQDPYYWLKERENPEVINYLSAENKYLDTVMSHLQPLRQELYEEITGRIKQDDNSVPYKSNGYFYYNRFTEGKEYTIHCRKKGSLDAQEEIMLDENILAEGHDYYHQAGQLVSDNNSLLAFAEDTLSRRNYTIRFWDLENKSFLADAIPNTEGGSFVWAADNQHIFYVKRDPVTLRSHQVWRHKLGTPVSADYLVYEEKDESYYTFISRSKNKQYVFIEVASTLTSETQYLAASNPLGDFKPVLPREHNHLYSVYQIDDLFYIVSNWEALNFRLMSVPVSVSAQKNKWKEVIAHRTDVLIEGIELFRDFLVVEERKNGLLQARIIPWKSSDEHYLDFGEPAYTAYPSVNLDFDTDWLRYNYQSLATPNSIYEYNMRTHEKKLLKQDEILGGYNPSDYVTERFFVPVSDGSQVPVSLIYKKGFVKDGHSPCLLYAYGSYGASMDAYFSIGRISLLDRGFCYAIAHIRGGQEMGRQWYEDGKLLKKKNTFTDYIDCAEHLIKNNYTSTDKLFAMGGSAGGLLMGAVVNLRPDLFKGVIAQVPFVDVVTTMLDESIPLTTNEFDEWGNPKNKIYYDYMLSYSPYDNVERKAYPAILVTTGLHDSQVQYWEPAKWVARLRELKTDRNPLLLYTNLETGHGGASGRFEKYKETAMEYAFLLDLVNDRPLKN